MLHPYPSRQPVILLKHRLHHGPLYHRTLRKPPPHFQSPCMGLQRPYLTCSWQPLAQLLSSCCPVNTPGMHPFGLCVSCSLCSEYAPLGNCLAHSLISFKPLHSLPFPLGFYPDCQIDVPPCCPSFILHLPSLALHFHFWGTFHKF